MHTPGPWQYNADFDEIQTRLGYKIIAKLSDDRTIGDEREANASLIAAAPALLVACEAAFEWLDRFAEHAPIEFGGEADLSERLRAAIAQARGDEPARGRGHNNVR